MLPFHQFGRDIIRSRFEELNSVLTCANLTNYPSNSTGAYAWIKCAEGVDCVKLFEKVNLLTIPGDAFGGTSQCKTLCVDVLHVWLGPQAFKHFRFGIWVVSHMYNCFATIYQSIIVASYSAFQPPTASNKKSGDWKGWV